jgi:hypothetical protein
MATRPIEANRFEFVSLAWKSVEEERDDGMPAYGSDSGCRT